MRSPVAWKIALVIAAATPTSPSSPMPRAPIIDYDERWLVEIEAIAAQ
jgi:hypothetical protein